MFNIPLNDQGWGLFVELIRNLVRSDIGSRATGLFGLLIAMLLGINGLNILSSFVGRDFMSAIAERQTRTYLVQGALYIGVFGLSTIVAVFLRYIEETLAFLCRDWMTRRFVDLYLQYPTYYRMNDAALAASGVEHPDQRIADDVKVFATTTLSFTLMALNGGFTILAFSGVLWTISPTLFLVALLYAGAGSYFTVFLGRRLIDLNYDQLDKEASFRSGLMHVRENTESIALLHRESGLRRRLFDRFDNVGINIRKIILVNRNLGFFTTGYNYLIQVIPVLIAAPLFVDENAEFGVITQAAMAFAMLVGAFSLVVTQFQSISSFAAVIQRLINLWYAIELAQTETISSVDIGVDGDRIVFDNLTLLAASDGQILVKNLSVEIPRGTRVLITASNDNAKDALLKALAGIADAGSGRVLRPSLDKILFLPEQPYIPPMTLREVFCADAAVSTLMDDEGIRTTLHQLGLGPLLEKIGGLDVEREWDSVLSLHDQQMLSFARIILARPIYAVLDLRSAADLAQDALEDVLAALTLASISYISIGHDGRRDIANRVDRYDASLDIKSDGSWAWDRAPH
jgi:putative ATP-binding cassette transporter